MSLQVVTMKWTMPLFSSFPLLDHHHLLYLASALASCLFICILLKFGQKKMFVTGLDAPMVVPSKIPWFGSALDIGNDLLGWTRNCVKKYGPVFGAHIAGKSYIFVTDQFAANRVINAKSTDMSWSIFRRMVSRSTMLMSQEDSEFYIMNDVEARSIMHNHLLKMDSLSELLINYQRYIKDIMFPQLINVHERSNSDGWLKKDIYDFVGQVLFNATSSAVFGLPDMATKECFEIFCKFDQRYIKFAESRFFQWRHKEQFQARKKYLSRLHESVKARDRNLSSLSSDKLLGVDLDKWMKDKKLSLDARVKGLAMTIHASVLNALPTTFWLLYHILESGEAYDAVVEEVRAIKQRSTTAVFTSDELKEMVKLDSIFTEVLRLETTWSRFRYRLVERDLDLNLPLVDGTQMSFFVKKGTVMMSCATFMNRDEEVFKNAEEFKWDRFVPIGDKPLEFRKSGKLISNPVDAFGGGPSYCPGRNFARGEIKALIALLLAEYDLRFADGMIPVKPAMYDNKTNHSNGVPAHDVAFEMRPRVI